MITPLALRQMFQTANIEAVRAAHEVSGQIQREQASKKTADDRAAEDQASVRGIPGADHIRAEARGRDRGQSGQEEGHPEGEPKGEAGDLEGEAGNADSHLDFLA